MNDYPQSEIDLMERIKRVCGPLIDAVSPTTSVPSAFLAALTASETGAYIWNTPDVPHRPETTVLSGLREVVNGTKYSFWGVTRDQLAAVGFDIDPLGASWGLTQIMGIHTLGWGCTVADLDNAATHYKWTLRLVAEFAEQYGLDVTKDFEQMFDCWNSGSPAGATYDPSYVHNGITRMKIYAEIA